MILYTLINAHLCHTSYGCEFSHITTFTVQMSATLSSVGSEMASLMSSIQENWFGNFLLNICAYGVIILPAALIIHYFKNSQSLQQRNTYINAYI